MSTVVRVPYRPEVRALPILDWLNEHLGQGRTQESRAVYRFVGPGWRWHWDELNEHHWVVEIDDPYWATVFALRWR